MADVVQLTEARESSRTEPLTLALWIAGVVERKRIIGAITLAAVVLAVTAALVLPPTYRVSVSFAANSSSPSKLAGGLSASSLSGLSGIAGQLGLGSMTEPSESPTFYTELLQSRELLTRLLLTRFPDPRTAAPFDSARLVDIMKLRSDDPQRRIELGVKALRKSMRAEADLKSNLINVTFDERWPDITAREANTALALVNTFNIQQRASRARSKRIYLQERLAEAKGNSAATQARYRDFLSSNRQWKQSPTLSSDETTLRQGVDIATDLYLSLEKQYEAARLEEFNDAALITVVDSAVTPRRPEWPRYSVLLPAALMGGIILGFIIAGVAAVYDDWERREPQAALRLRSAFHRRGTPEPDATRIVRRA